MEYLIILLLFILLIVFIYRNYKTKQNYQNLEKKKIEDFSEEIRHKCETIKEEKEREVKNFKDAVDRRMSDLQLLLSEKEKRYEEVNIDLSTYKTKRKEDIDAEVLFYLKTKYENANKELDNLVVEYEKKFEENKLEKQKEIKEIENKLEDLRSQRAAVNEEILRQKKLQEQEDFYKIQLPEEDKPDIEVLRQVAPRLRHPEAINKIIWSNYYQKPLAELRKRLLPNGDYSGVYKITRLKTGEIYIGQTSSLDKRFQEHTKSALGVGTLTSSQLHRTMATDGPENFTFEILEKVEKDKLKEREAYYIDFYDSKNYGLNTIRGQNK